MYRVTITYEAEILTKHGRPAKWLSTTTLKIATRCDDMRDVYSAIQDIQDDFEVVDVSIKRIKERADCPTKEYYEEDEC